MTRLHPNSAKPYGDLFGVFGLFVLVVSLVALRAISQNFAYEVSWLEKPVVLCVTLMVLAGIGYICYLSRALRSFKTNETDWQPIGFTALIITGLLLRIMWLGSEPILEDDSYRYFWDGALITSGINPYATAPNDALSATFLTGFNQITFTNPELANILATGAVDRVAYPSITTIYPPITQLFFGIHNLVAPWDLNAWRLLLLGADIASLLFIIKLLAQINRDIRLSFIFWLNPLLITETMNAGHMDALMLPFITAAAFCLVTYRFQIAAVLLSVCIGIKIWPVLLVPVFIAYWYKNANFFWKQIAGFTVTVAILSSLILMPQLLTTLTSNTGLVAYSSEWQTNAMLFQWVNLFWSSLTVTDYGWLSRATVVMMLVCVLAIVCLNQRCDPTKNLLIITAALFLLSPTGYPWYFLWLFPWLALNPNLALLCLTATLPLYDLRFSPWFDNNPNWFEYVVIPMQFVPVFILALWSGTQRKQNPAQVSYAR